MVDPEKKREQLRAADRRHRMKRRVEKYGLVALTQKFAGKHGNHASGEQSGKWKGGRMVDKDGYVLVRVGRRYLREHRVIAELLLGRPLTKVECVHHVDGNKSNNVPENLEVTTFSLHRKYHDVERGRDYHGRFPGSMAHVAPKRDSLGRYSGGKLSE